MVKRLLPFLLMLSAPLLFTVPAMAEKAPFGLQSLEISATNENGSPDVQAGSHPYKLTTSFVLDMPEVLNGKGEQRSVEAIEQEGEIGHLIPAGHGLRDVQVQLPPGFVGNPDATPKCTYPQFSERRCPVNTVIGEATTEVNDPRFHTAEEEAITYSNPVYNLESPGHIAAEFAYYAIAAPVFLDSSVRTGGDYGVTVNASHLPQIIAVYASKITIWGVPAASSHDLIRGECLSSGLSEAAFTPGPGEEIHNEEKSLGDCPAGTPPVPLLTNPTSCGESRTATMSVDSWETPGNFATGENVVTRTATLPPLSGCEKLNFQPSLSVTTDGAAGSTPTGLNVHVHVPQESTTNPEGLGEADVKSTTVALPPGVQISPSASDGLQACSNAQIGFEGYRELDASGRQTPIFSPGAPSCPIASKIANVRIKTPLLEGELTGSVYLAAPQNFSGPLENPFGSLIAMYLVAEEPEHGVLVKLPGEVALNQESGQITTTFENTPEFPFSDLQLEFYGTARAPLATPALCGTYATEASFEPWSRTPAAHPPASFQITSGPNGSPCSDPLPFSPTLASGTTNISSGSFSELTTTLGREDGQQNIQSVTLHYPAGLSGLLSGVKLCGEAEANAGTCGPESQIGESIVSVGLGNDPFTVVGGKVYITGPYEGAPFGLSIINPAKAGPYVLQEGRPVVVRAKIEVNPITAALTVTTNPSGPYAIPHIIEGIPLNIKHVNVLINRADFTFNPTNCDPTQVTGTINSDEGASSPVAIPFQVTNCGALKFTPKFTVSTSGKTSKADGASLTATVSEPSDPAGQSNITRVKVDLPKQLPSRLTTLQKACLAKVFEANPAACPPASFIGHATVHTQLLPVPLEGPAIFVSHGGEAFPSLEIVLQGYGVTIDLVGATYISPAGITSTTFKTVPDQPFETFSLTLPEGPYSALGTNYDLCTQNLQMPTEFVGQDGTKINDSTKIEVAGCSSSLSVVSSSVKKRTLTLSVYAPAAGKVTASGKGVSSGSKSYSGREALTFTLKQKKAGKLKTKIKLTFTPSNGKRQAKTVKAAFKH